MIRNCHVDLLCEVTSKKNKIVPSLQMLLACEFKPISAPHVVRTNVH